jgi:anti-sigma B factor antagonist
MPYDGDFDLDGADGALAARGELDVATAEQFLQALAAHDGDVLLVDLAGLSFIDSSGLRALVQARRDHRRLQYVNPSPNVRRLFQLTGLEAELLD